ALTGEKQFDLRPAAGFADLWELPAADCSLTDGQIYHYWFEVDDTDPGKDPPARIRCGDPFAHTVDWRLTAPRLPRPPYSGDDERPAAVVRFAGGQIVPCDPGGETGDFTGDPAPDTLAPNNRLVIYELPTAWAQLRQGGRRE